MRLRNHDILKEINCFNAGNCKAVSYFYKILIGQMDSDTTLIRKAWKEDVGFTTEEEHWKECLPNIHECSINARHNLIK